MTATQPIHVRQALNQVRALRTEVLGLQRQLCGPLLKYSRAAHAQSLGLVLHRIALQLEGAASALLAGDEAPPVLPLRNARPAAPVLRYERKPKAEGRWVTIGAKRGEDGKKRGGSPVFIEGGRIIKGHPSLTGRAIDALKEEPVEVSGRKQRDWARGYERAQWGKQAKQAGLDPQELHQLAAEILGHDQAFAKDRTRLLQRARKLSAAMGYGSLQGLHLRTAKGIDADAVRGLDDVAERLAEEFPEHFAGHGEPQERLFDLLTEGNPEAMSEDQAYRQAFDHLSEGPEGEVEDLEPAPFRRGGVPLRYGLLRGPERYSAGGEASPPGQAPLLPGPPKPQTPAGILRPHALPGIKHPAALLPPPKTPAVPTPLTSAPHQPKVTAATEVSAAESLPHLGPQKPGAATVPPPLEDHGITPGRNDWQAFITHWQTPQNSTMRFQATFDLDGWQLQFGIPRMDGRLELNQPEGKATSARESLGTFSNVMRSIMAFTRARRPWTFHFAAKTSEPSRVRMYDTLSRQISELTGYQLERKEVPFRRGILDVFTPGAKADIEEIKYVFSMPRGHQGVPPVTWRGQHMAREGRPLRYAAGESDGPTVEFFTDTDTPPSPDLQWRDDDGQPRGA